MAKEIKPAEVVDDPWSHRTDGMKCLTCMWYVKKATKLRGQTSEVLNEIGRCRRHAPTMNGYPVVYFKDWCGDHKLNENAL